MCAATPSFMPEDPNSDLCGKHVTYWVLSPGPYFLEGAGMSTNIPLNFVKSTHSLMSLDPHGNISVLRRLRKMEAQEGPSFIKVEWVPRRNARRECPLRVLARLYFVPGPMQGTAIGGIASQQ